jgi:hypothetical protein
MTGQSITHSVRVDKDHATSRYQWRCTCGKHGGWTDDAAHARRSGRLHASYVGKPRGPL